MRACGATAPARAPTDARARGATARAPSNTAAGRPDARTRGAKRRTNPAHLPEGRRELRHRSQQYWEERADAIGEEVGAYIRDIFASDDVLLLQLRTVQAIVTHLEDHPVHRARAACARARYFASYTYGALKNILRKGLDLQPLPD